LQQITIEQALSRAKKAAKKGNTAVALQFFNAVLQHQPNHPVAKKGLRKLQKGLPQNQAVQAGAAIPSQDQLDALTNLYHSGQMVETEQACRELLLTHPQSLIVINILGAALQGQGKLQEAVASYGKAIQLNPEYAYAYSNRGNALRELGLLDEAMSDYEKAIQLKPDYADAYSNQGIAHQAKGQLQEAISSYDIAIQLKPDCAEAYSNRGNVLKDLSRLDDAVASYEKAIELKPDFASAYSGIGIVLQELGRFDDAVACYKRAIDLNPSFSEAFSNLGNALQELERLGDAIVNYDSAIAIKPDFADAYSNRGNALKELGRLTEAVASYQKSIQLKPDSVVAYSNCGNALKELGKLDEALTFYKRAIDLNPTFAEAYYNQGITLQELGQLDDALANYERSIELEPNYAKAYSNRGTALQEQGLLNEALASYENAIQLDPEYADAFSNLGAVLKELDQLEASISNYQKAISIDPENRNFWSGFSEVLEIVRFSSYDENLAFSLLEILEQPTVRPSDVSGAVASLLRHHPVISEALELTNSNNLSQNIVHIAEKLSTVPLLLRILELSSIPDFVLEKMLTQVRKATLHKVVYEGIGNNSGLQFFSTLALNCFTNEYVFSESEQEQEEIRLLQERVGSAFSSMRTPSHTEILVLGAYRPLHTFSWSRDILSSDTYTDIKNVIHAQINNANYEQNLRSSIQRLDLVQDRVSELVRDQYEENPYPRWIKTGLSDKPTSMLRVLQSIGVEVTNSALQFPENPDILVAGCGTGQHALSTAARFSNCRVLALDLSLSSLCYALRKTQELGISNIEYLQADILGLNQLDREFHIIESVGVLHHMDNPLSGWKALVDKLCINGYMKIGLYSELARNNIVQARREIELRGYSPSLDDIRKYRDEIISRSSDFTIILGSRDFYSLSTCRDLLFHVQEHRFTLPQLENSLHHLGLRFLGFEMKNSSKHKFRKLYPDHDAMRSLRLWHEFELENPDTFAGMYQFWVQKIR